MSVVAPGLSVAVVGSGPAACYAVQALIDSRVEGLRIEVFEKLPTPFGLARFGVAPDHVKTRSITETFARALESPEVTLHLGVEVGADVAHDELAGSHDAILYAHGCAGSAMSEVPGHHLPGSHTARSFVEWYNGHPQRERDEFDLTSERAVVIGNGNVALDVARILSRPVDDLATTLIAPRALEALAASRVREVVVLGRRGPREAAFSLSELVGLCQLDDVDVVVDGVSEADGETFVDQRADALASYKLRLLRTLVHSSNSSSASRRRIVLKFRTRAVELLGDRHVESVRLRQSAGFESESSMDSGLVLHAVGYRGRRLPGLPFDEARGIVPNVAGRVTAVAGDEPVAGVYVAGWIKRGPSGVMGTNKWCARESVEQLLTDHRDGSSV
ncbi:MAG: FAD-dependent oxidoreductase [Nocardioides sp.]|uniref:FAD-dependent oxidoreductase n=1 Tax=Nocardioides sp. TaxID=35761 RepID=UPI0032658C04